MFHVVEFLDPGERLPYVDPQEDNEGGSLPSTEPTEL